MGEFRRCILTIVLVVWTACGALSAHAAGPATPDDTARFLAGMPPSSGSPLAATAQAPGWRAHAGEMERAWADLDHRHMNWIRLWARATLPPPRPTMFYMFGGPDFLHAEGFFPDASTYVLSGLEPVGRLPDASALPPGMLAALRASMGNFLQYGYFITSEMGEQLTGGTLPLLYVFLARAGKTIDNIGLLRLSSNGTIAALRPGKARGANGVRIVFSGQDRRPRRLYYFRTDLSDAGLRKSGFLKFCARLGTGDSLVKSASYLMHTGGFSRVRAFLLGQSAVIVQDDSGIPLRYFKRKKWRLRPFGQYLGPIDEFKRYYQPDLAALFNTGAQPVRFGIGYRWHPQRTNVLLAVRRAVPAGRGR